MIASIKNSEIFYRETSFRYAILFSFFIFSTSLVSYPFVYNSIKDGKELYVLTITGLWMTMAGFLWKGRTKVNFLEVDLFVTLFILYSILNFYFLSYFNITYSQFLLLACYCIIYYMFRSSYRFGKRKYNNLLFHLQIRCIFFVLLAEILIATMQYRKVIESRSDYFDVLGTFVNPNFLGLNMSIGIIIILSLYKRSEARMKFLYLILLIPTTALLIHTESRACWIALFGAFLIYIFSSNKNRNLITKLSSKLKISMGIIFFSLLSGSAFFLYRLGVDSVRGRLLILKIGWEKVLDNPVFGNGIFNFSITYNNLKANYFLSEDRPWQEMKVANIINTAFNDYFQILFELGLLGVCLIVSILFISIKKMEFNQNSRVAISILALILFVAVFTSVLYNPSAMVIACWSLATITNENKSIQKRWKLQFKKIYKLLFLAAGITFFFLAIIRTYSFKEFKQMMEKANTENHNLSGRMLSQKFDLIDENSFIKFRIGYEQMKNGNILGIQKMNTAVEKINDTELNRVLAGIYESRGERDLAERLYIKNVGLEPYRFKHRINLMEFYQRLGEWGSVKRTAEEILNLPVKIPSTEVDEYKARAGEIMRE